MGVNGKKEFMERFTDSLASNTFVKATLANYRGSDEQLQRILIRRVETKKGVRLSLLYRHDKRDIVKNHGVEDAFRLIDQKLGTDFFSGHLFTTQADFQLDMGKKGTFRLHRAKPTFGDVPTLEHDRKKQRLVDSRSFYLKLLAITDDRGQVLKGRQKKWKQINRFVEMLAAEIGQSGLAERASLDVIDMGSGKGYLTFAAYDYLKNSVGIKDLSVTGIDENPDLVEFCNEVAESCAFEGLRFNCGTIRDQMPDHLDILIALHACDTATDEALYRGVTSRASLILVSPCCHKELRKQIKPLPGHEAIIAHGTLAEAQSEIITDGLRALFLAKNGYKTKVFEFVPTSHTPKNNLICGVLGSSDAKTDRYRRQIDKIKQDYGIEEFHLEALLQNEPAD